MPLSINWSLGAQSFGPTVAISGASAACFLVTRVVRTGTLEAGWSMQAFDPKMPQTGDKMDTNTTTTTLTLEFVAECAAVLHLMA